MCGLTDKLSTSGHFIKKSKTELKVIHITMLEGATTKKCVCVCCGQKGENTLLPSLYMEKLLESLKHASNNKKVFGRLALQL